MNSNCEAPLVAKARRIRQEFNTIGAFAVIYAKSELTESELWIRLIASPRSRAMLTCLIFGQAFAAAESGMLSVTTTSVRTEAAMRSIGLLRFHLLALKAAAVVQMRLGRLADARARLAKVLEMDQRDQLGARGLLTLLDARIAAGAGEIAEETDHEHCQPV